MRSVFIYIALVQFPYFVGTTSRHINNEMIWKRVQKRPSFTVPVRILFLVSVLLLCVNIFMFRGMSATTNYTISSIKYEDQNDAYTSALATMGCFATPDCFPSSNCRTGMPQKIPRKKKWEEQSFCVEDLKKAALQAEGCLVYSFGIHVSWEWEEKVAKQFGCEVHAFDPTMNHTKDLAPGVTFHKLGLQAEGMDMSVTHSAHYDAIDPTLLLALPNIMKRLGHDRRSLDLLMMDCEGCEWGVLRHLACSKESERVKQIVTEFHFQKNLGLETEADVLNAAMGVRCLWRERWHIVSIESSGADRADWEYAKGIPSILSGSGMLLGIALQRVPDDEPLPAELKEAYATKARLLGRLRKKEWPQKAQDEILSFAQRLHAVERPKVKFDDWQRMVERK